MGFYGRGVQPTDQKYRVVDVRKLVAFILRIVIGLGLAYG